MLAQRAATPADDSLDGSASHSLFTGQVQTTLDDLRRHSFFAPGRHQFLDGFWRRRTPCHALSAPAPPDGLPGPVPVKEVIFRVTAN